MEENKDIMSIEDAKTRIENLEKELKEAKERADNYYKWYSAQITETSKANEKLNAIKTMIAVI